MQEAIRVGILMGGRSEERLVSLASGCNLVDMLDRNRFEIHPIEIGQDGKWYLHHIDSPLLESGITIGRDWNSGQEYQPPAPEFSELVTARVIKNRIDVMFLALHGPGGEDGTIQGYLESHEIPYVGSGVLASALTMDKARCKVFLKAMGIPTPAWLFFTRDQWERESQQLRETIASSFPEGCVVKANNQGSSIGVSLVDGDEDPGEAIQEALRFSREVLVEERLSGREFSCGVYGSEQAEALPVTEIRTANGFFDYESKYQPGGAEEITPAEISPDETLAIQSLALRTHQVLDCRGVTRTDVMWDNSGQPQVIEINTIPGMTRMSLIPRACQAAGIEFEAVLERLIGETLFEESLIPIA